MFDGPKDGGGSRRVGFRERAVPHRALALVSVAILMFALLLPGRWVAFADSVTLASPAFDEVSAGGRQTCGLLPDGDAACWGVGFSDGNGVVGEVAGPFTSISVGEDHACAVRDGGGITCWGDNSYGRAPAEVVGSFSAVSAGDTHTCALDGGGGVSCWGDNSSGQAPQEVEGSFLSVSAGFVHTCAVKADQNVACWGNNDVGQAPSVVVGPFESVSAGAGHTCGVKSDGSIACWGANDSGQAPALTAGPFTRVSAGTRHTCAVRATGSIACWGGDNYYGQAPAEVAGPFDSVSVGDTYGCGLRTNDALTCWGRADSLPALPWGPYPVPSGWSVGRTFRHVFATTGSPPSTTFAVQGVLPAGLTLSADGTLSGIPRTAGTFTYTVSETNLFGVATEKVTQTILPWFDVNADGYADLPVGAPGEDVGSIVDAGAVTVLFGSARGTYGQAGSLQITQETVGQTSEKGDKFGTAIAVADVTGDAQLDLVIGAPGENAGAGQVVVVHGSPTRMTGATRTVLRQGLSGAAGAAEAGDGFGSTISVGNGLWVGAPGENLGRATDAGVVTRFLAKPLRTASSIQYQQGSRGVPGSPESGDRFGAALAGGGTIIGVPGENVGSTVDAGIVTVSLTRAVSQDSPGIPGGAERGDQFGAAVASTRLYATDSENGGQSYLDLLAIGAPGEDIGSLTDAGSVTLIDRDSWDYPDFDDGGDPSSLVQNSLSAGQTVEPGDRFGASLMIATKTIQVQEEDGFRSLTLETEASLAVGAPGEDVGARANAGAVTILPAAAGCSDECDYYVEGGRTITQGSGGTGNTFGATVGELPGIELGLVIGAPGQNVNSHPSAGTVTVLNP